MKGLGRKLGVPLGYGHTKSYTPLGASGWEALLQVYLAASMIYSCYRSM